MKGNAFDMAKERSKNFNVNRKVYRSSTEPLDELHHTRFDQELIGAMMALTKPADFEALCSAIGKRKV